MFSTDKFARGVKIGLAFYEDSSTIGSILVKTSDEELLERLTTCIETFNRERREKEEDIYLSKQTGSGESKP